MKKIFTIIMLAAMTLAAMAQQKKVAVYVTGEQSGVSKVLGDQLVAAFAKSGRYAAIERTTSFLAELNKEHGYERSGAVNDNQIARLGVQFGVNYVCVAEMTDAFGEKYISARLIDVETAEVVNTHSVSGEMNSMSTCVQMASEIATNLSKGSFAEQAEDSKQKKYKELQKQGYVDMGLPSGTWWKKENEKRCFLYSEAYQEYGNRMPTKEQYSELLKSCSWEWLGNGNGYKLVSRYNGEYIFFPDRGCVVADNDWFQGIYWTRSTFYDSGIESNCAYIFKWHYVGENGGIPMKKLNNDPLKIEYLPYGKSRYGNGDIKRYSVKLVIVPSNE